MRERDRLTNRFVKLELLFKHKLKFLYFRTKTKWSLKILESCDRTKSNTLRLNFDTVKKDKQERVYTVEEDLCQVRFFFFDFSGFYLNLLKITFEGIGKKIA